MPSVARAFDVVVGRIEGGEVEPLTEDEHLGHMVAAAARARHVVAAGAAVGVRCRHLVEVAREQQRVVAIRERLSGAGGVRPAAAFLGGPVGSEQIPAVIEDILERQRKLVAVVKYLTPSSGFRIRSA